MAKKSKIARNEQRKVVVERYAAKRAELKKALVDPNGTDESREAARGCTARLRRERLSQTSWMSGPKTKATPSRGCMKIKQSNLFRLVVGELPGIPSPLIGTRRPKSH